MSLLNHSGFKISIRSLNRVACRNWSTPLQCQIKLLKIISQGLHVERTRTEPFRNLIEELFLNEVWPVWYKGKALYYGGEVHRPVKNFVWGMVIWGKGWNAKESVKMFENIPRVLDWSLCKHQEEKSIR